MFDTISTWWQSVKDWFHNSETILIARVEAFTGFIIATFSALDFSPLTDLFGTNTGITWKQGLTIGGFFLIKGLISEWARRRNTVTVDDKLVPTDIVKSTTVVTPAVTTTTVAK